MDIFLDQISDSWGNGVGNAQISVYDELGALATLYNPIDGSQLANPFKADEVGNWTFQAQNGRYRVRIDGQGVTPREFYVFLQDLSAVTGVITIAQGGTGATTAAAARTALGLGLLDTPNFGGLFVPTIQLENVDCTLNRFGPGDMLIEGQLVYRTAGFDVQVDDGGSGRSSATPYAVLCGGTIATGPHQSIASVGAAGQVLTSNGAGQLPSFQPAAGGGGVTVTTGTFTPVAEIGGAGLTASWSVAEGRYTRIGNLVIARVVITSDGAVTHANGGNLEITGLPFSQSSGPALHRGVGACAVKTFVGWGSPAVTGFSAEVSGTIITIRKSRINFVAQTLTHGYLDQSDLPSGANFDFELTVIYETGDP